MHKILISEPLNESSVQYLVDRSDVVRCEAGDVLEHIDEVDGLVVRSYTQVNDELLSHAPNLKVVGRAGVALENVDVQACRARGVEVVHTPEANTLAVVDYTIGAIINMNRRYWPMDSCLGHDGFHTARKASFGRFLSGATLGIVGLGRIGSRVGRAASALGMNVLYNDIIDIDIEYPAQSVDKPTLYAQSDIITIHVPLDSSTIEMINADAIASFKSGVQFINAARGQCVNYHALADAIKSQQISAATIDCHYPEPPPKNYPLFGLDNTTLTPHIAARVPDAVQNMCDVVHDVLAVLDGEKPKFPAPHAGGE